MGDPLFLARSVAAHLTEVPGVRAVVLGGSLARGEGSEGSDVDLGIYYRGSDTLSIPGLLRLARELDDRYLPDLVTSVGEWGPWINGGGWLRISGRPVDWLYRDLDRVEEVVRRCLDGETACHYQPGHPHGFHEHIYAGEVHYCRPLYDPDGQISRLKSLVADYPPALKETLVGKYLWEAAFALDTARKPARRGDVFYVSGCLFRCAASLVQVIFALNGRYFVNEKGSVRAAGRMPRSPEGFEESVTNVLASCGRDAGTLEQSVERMEEIRVSVSRMCEDIG